jgi:hypothetical protein
LVIEAAKLQLYGRTIMDRYLVIGAMLAISAAVMAPAFGQSASPKPLLEGKVMEEERAIAILKATSARLAAAKTMSFTAINTYEVPAANGQPLYYTTESRVTLERPNKLRVITPGDGVPDEFYYDGKTMTAYVPSADLKAVAPAPPTIEAMLDAAWEKGAIYFPFDDVIAADPYAELSTRLTSAFYVGQSHVVGGTVTDMVALSSDKVQGELWIGAEDKLPRLVKVVYGDRPGSPHYETVFTDWKLDIGVPADTFAANDAAAAKIMPFAAPATPDMPLNPGAPGNSDTMERDP